MHPTDHVVAQVHRVGIIRQHLNVKCVPEACRFERLVPPRRAFQQRAANWFRRPVVNVINNRLDRLRDGSGGILLLKPVTADPSLFYRLVDRRSIIVKLDAMDSDSRIEPARFVATAGQLDERMVLPNRDGEWCGVNLASRADRAFGGERQQRFDLRCSLERLGAAEVNRASRFVARYRSGGPDATARSRCASVAEKEAGTFYENHVAFGMLRP